MCRHSKPFRPFSGTNKPVRLTVGVPGSGPPRPLSAYAAVLSGAERTGQALETRKLIRPKITGERVSFQTRPSLIGPEGTPEEKAKRDTVILPVFGPSQNEVDRGDRGDEKKRGSPLFASMIEVRAKAARTPPKGP